MSVFVELQQVVLTLSKNYSVEFFNKMYVKNIFQKIIRLGIEDLNEDSNLFAKVKALNKIMLVFLFIAFSLLTLGLTIPYKGFQITGSFLSILLTIALYLTSQKRFALSWHLIFSTPPLVIAFLPFLAEVSPSLMLFFITFQSLVVLFFNQKRIITFYFFYYSICGIAFLYFLFELNPGQINLSFPVNVYTLIISLVITYYALQFYISGKEHNEMTLRLEKEKFSTLFDKSPVGIMVTDITNNRKRTVNKALINMLGYTEEELTSIKIEKLTHPEDRTLHLERMKKLWNNEILFFELEKRYIHKNGGIIRARIVITNIKGNDNQPLYNVATVHNITEQKIQQQKIEELINELQKVNLELEQKVEQRTDDLKVANEELKRSNQDLEQFAYAASHDMKEPLRMIGSFVQILKRKYSDKIDDKGKEYIDFSIEGVNRMSDLINSLLQYSRVGRKESKIRETNVANIIEGKLIDLRQLIDEKNATINIQNMPSNLSCEPVQLGLVFYNLINNGLKFNENLNPTITVNATEEPNQVIFSVADNGIGIDDKFKENVFDIFKRLHTREKYEGTGIGLALCRKIIQRHNGDIWLESETGKGTTFYFTISKHL